MNAQSPDAAGRDIAAELLAWRASTITDHDALLEGSAAYIQSLRAQLAEKEKELEGERILFSAQFIELLDASHKFCEKLQSQAIRKQTVENISFDEFEALLIEHTHFDKASGSRSVYAQALYHAIFQPAEGK
jgi:hypothetical protein